jgi:hypothetical protein
MVFVGDDDHARLLKRLLYFSMALRKESGVTREFSVHSSVDQQ